MLSIKEFEKSVHSIAKVDLLKRTSRGMYIPYIETLIKKAQALPMERSVEVDVQDPKKAMALANATRLYLKKTKMDGKFTAGNFRTFVYCGKRNDKTND